MTSRCHSLAYKLMIIRAVQRHLMFEPIPKCPNQTGAGAGAGAVTRDIQFGNIEAYPLPSSHLGTSGYLQQHFIFRCS